MSIRAYGVPVPQGSLKAVVSRSTGKPMVKPSNEAALAAWRDIVAWTARSAWSGEPLDKACRVGLSFFLARPKYHFGSERRIKSEHLQARPASKPDIDKLARAVLDGLTGITFFDDSQVVDLSLSKHYAEPAPEGCAIEIVWEER